LSRSCFEPSSEGRGKGPLWWPKRLLAHSPPTPSPIPVEGGEKPEKDRMLAPGRLWAEPPPHASALRKAPLRAITITREGGPVAAAWARGQGRRGGAPSRGRAAPGHQCLMVTVHRTTDYGWGDAYDQNSYTLMSWRGGGEVLYETLKNIVVEDFSDYLLMSSSSSSRNDQNRILSKNTCKNLQKSYYIIQQYVPPLRKYPFL